MEHEPIGTMRERELDDEFLRQECTRWTESFWRNETLGEERVKFYVTLVTAALGALVAMLTADEFDSRLLRPLGSAALGVVLVIGAVTFLRIARRNRAKEEYLFRAGRIRRYFVGSAYEKFYGNVLDPAPSWSRGGLAVLVSVMNGIVAGALVALWLAPRGLPVMAAATIAVLVLSIWGQLRWTQYDETRTRTSIKKNAGADPPSPWR